MRRIVRTFYRLLRKINFPDYVEEVRRAVGDSKSLLDVGCGYSSPIKSFSAQLSYTVGIDAFQPSVELSRKLGIHNVCLRMEALDIEKRFGDRSFDCVLALQLIEHLPKEDGIRLLCMMEKIAKKRVVVVAPNGFLPNLMDGGNPYWLHKSGWTAQEMRSMGYSVEGIDGWKKFAEKIIRIRNRFVRRFLYEISDITEIFVRTKPQIAFHLLCVKTKDSKQH